MLKAEVLDQTLKDAEIEYPWEGDYIFPVTVTIDGAYYEVTCIEERDVRESAYEIDQSLILYVAATDQYFLKPRTHQSYTGGFYGDLKEVKPFQKLVTFYE